MNVCNSYLNQLIFIGNNIKQCCFSKDELEIKNIDKLSDLKLNVCKDCKQFSTKTSDNSEHIHSLYISLHNLCNGKCMMCDIVKKDIYYTDYKYIFEKYKNELIYLEKISVVGGEPMINENLLLDFLIYVQQNFKHVKKIRIITNGTFFSQKIFDKLSEFDDFLISVSIDGYKDTNYLLRRLNYDVIIENIKKFSNFTKNIKIMYTITSANFKNIYELKKIYNDLKEYIFSIDIQFCTIPQILSINNINIKRLLNVKKTLEKLNEEIKIISYDDFFEYIDLIYKENY